jgi:aldehyde dehydrogenase
VLLEQDRSPIRSAKFACGEKSFPAERIYRKVLENGTLKGINVQATANEQTIRNIVQEVLTQLTSRNGAAAKVNGTSGPDTRWGVFSTVDEAVAAAQKGFEKLSRASLEDRKKAIDIVKQICDEQAEELGRWNSKKPKSVGSNTRSASSRRSRVFPGVEFLRTDAISGSHGLMITEYAPFGVIGAITPVTHSLPTLAGNFVNMVAAGNTIVCNPHPSGAKIASEGVRRFNKAIFAATGLENLVNIIGTPTIETAQQVFDHRGVKMLVVTGGPAVARAALQSPKRAIVAGPGNPPVVVDATADIDNAAKSIVAGAAFDNSLLCISEKEVFAVKEIFDQLMNAVSNHGGYRLNAAQVAAFTAKAFGPPKEPGGHLC